MEVTLTHIGFLWLIIIVICIIEAHFTVPYDKEFEELKKKKNEHKSTS